MNRDDVWIQTFSGKKFNLFNPNPDDILIEDIAHSLSNLARFNGHTDKFYSVAQHSVYCSFKSPHRLSLAALLHDGAEAYLGDIVSPLKSFLCDYLPFEDALYALIAEKYISDSLTVDDYRLIHNIDLRMLATEKYHLMGYDLKWDLIEGVNIYNDIHIDPLPPRASEKLFLDCFYRWCVE